MCVLVLRSFCKFSPPMEYNAAQWGAADDVTNADFPGRKFLPDTLKRIR